MARARTEPAPAPETTPAASDDVVLVHGRTEDGALAVLRKKGDELSAGELRPLEEGRPVSGSILRLAPREGMPFLADVREEIPVPGPSRGAGPARVSNPRFRAGWDQVFGKDKGKARAKGGGKGGSGLN